VVLAHVGRSFNHRTVRGLTAFTDRPNIVVDTSAITEPESIKFALGTLGVDRVLYGSDYPISHFRGRCVTAGDSFQWIYADEMNNPRMTLIGIESLLSHRKAAEDLGLRRAEIERIFYGNAWRLLGRDGGAPA
jgi:predicted TIM-barrel fold metal-dependent hydrolase